MVTLPIKISSIPSMKGGASLYDPYSDQRFGGFITQCDFNGDGFPDLIATENGDLYVFPGSANGFSGKINIEQMGPARIGFASKYDGFATNAVSIGDFNGDRKCDFAVSAPTATLVGKYFNQYSNAGIAYIVYGADNLTKPYYYLDSYLDGSNGFSVLTNTPPQRGLKLGSSMSGGVNVAGDENPEIIIGNNCNNCGNNGGNAYIVKGMDSNFPASLDVADSTIVAKYMVEVAETTYPVALIPDMTGDGYGEIVAGNADENGFAGELTVYFGGKYLPSKLKPSMAASGKGMTIFSSDKNISFNNAVLTYADMRGNGDYSLVVGMPGSNNNDGLVFLLDRKCFAGGSELDLSQDNSCTTKIYSAIPQGALGQAVNPIVGGGLIFSAPQSNEATGTVFALFPNENGFGKTFNASSITTETGLTFVGDSNAFRPESGAAVAAYNKGQDNNICYFIGSPGGLGGGQVSVLCAGTNSGGSTPIIPIEPSHQPNHPSHNVTPSHNHSNTPEHNGASTIGVSMFALALVSTAAVMGAINFDFDGGF